MTPCSPGLAGETGLWPEDQQIAMHRTQQRGIFTISWGFALFLFEILHLQEMEAHTLKLLPLGLTLMENKSQELQWRQVKHKTLEQKFLGKHICLKETKKTLETHWDMKKNTKTAHLP